MDINALVLSNPKLRDQLIKQVESQVTELQGVLKALKKGGKIKGSTTIASASGGTRAKRGERQEMVLKTLKTFGKAGASAADLRQKAKETFGYDFGSSLGTTLQHMFGADKLLATAPKGQEDKQKPRYLWSIAPAS